MTTELYENDELKLYSKYDGEKRVYYVVLNGATLVVTHPLDLVKV